MAILKDHYNENKFLEFKLLHRNKNPDQGCSILITGSDTEIGSSIDFGWTNYTLERFLEMLAYFPMELYDGYFSHYDESFEWKWYYERSSDLYVIIIFASGWIPTFKVNVQELREFGKQVSDEIKITPEKRVL